MCEPCDGLEGCRVPKHRATGPIATQNSAFVGTENRAGDAVRVNKLRNLFAGIGVPNARRVIPRRGQHTLSVSAEDCALDYPQFIELRFAVL